MRDPRPALRGAKPVPAGFTLLEILVVLAVLGLALALVAARGFGPSPAVQVRAAADTVAATLRSARGRAILTDRIVIVRLDAAAHALAVDADAPLRLPSTVALAGPAAIRFAPDGSATEGQIALAGGGRRLLVSVEWLTGRVSLAAAP